MTYSSPDSFLLQLEASLPDEAFTVSGDGTELVLWRTGTVFGGDLAGAMCVGALSGEPVCAMIQVPARREPTVEDVAAAVRDGAKPHFRIHRPHPFDPAIAANCAMQGRLAILVHEWDGGLSPAVEAFGKAVDFEALALLEGVGQATDAAYAWITGRDRARRMAFATAYPVLLPLAVNENDEGFLRDLASLPPDEVAARFVRDVCELGGDAARLVVRLRHLCWPADMQLDLVNELLTLLEAPQDLLPEPLPGPLPATHDLQQGFLGFLALHEPLSALAEVSGRPHRDILGRVGDWAGYVRVLGERARRPARVDEFPDQWGWAVVTDSMLAIHDMVRAFEAEVIRPALHRHSPEAAAAMEAMRQPLWMARAGEHPTFAAALRLLLGARTLPALAELSDRWHANVTAIARQMVLAAGEDAPRGNRIFEDFDLGGGLYATNLVTAHDLVAEGDPGPDATGAPGLDHCVGSYAERVATGDAVIVSIRRRLPDGGYERLSTAELMAHDLGDGREVLVTQHMGHGNSPPPDEAVVALERLNEGIADTARWDLLAGPPDYDDFDAMMEGPKRFDWAPVLARPGVWEQVRDAWSFALTRPQRGMSAAELLEAAGIDPEALVAGADPSLVVFGPGA